MGEMCPMRISNDFQTANEAEKEFTAERAGEANLELYSASVRRA